MPKHLTRLKPSLLQWLSEGNMLRLDYNQTVPNLSGMNQGTLMPTEPLMNSFLKSVRTPTNQKGGTPLAHPSTMVMQMNLQTKSEESLSPKCLGTTEKRKPGEAETRIAKSLDESCNFSPAITKLSDNGSRTHEQHPSDSLVQSGITLSKDKQSTLMPCSHHCTIYLLIKRTLDTWDQLKYPLVNPNQPRRSKRVANGPAHGTPLSK